jgi:serine-type D-Ala-D-Ala carboxypeptidase/endopeptidase (penicillin-binding protein 4)
VIPPMRALRASPQGAWRPRGGPSFAVIPPMRALRASPQGAWRPRGGPSFAVIPPMRAACLLAIAAALVPLAAHAVLPREITRAFVDQGVPMSSVAVVVQETGAQGPLFSHQPDRAMNPASVMKLVTTFAALDLLGRNYRWRTEAYLGGPLVDGTLDGDLILKGGGDPKITVEQWASFIAMLRERGLSTVTGDLVLDRSAFRLPPHDPGAFDGEPLMPYNVGPDALLVNFKVVKFHFAPTAAGPTL